jgi:hypothetical protein
MGYQVGNMREIRQPKKRNPIRLIAGIVQLDGILMPCEYVRNRRQLFQVVMLGDIEFGQQAGAWRNTVVAAARLHFETIEPYRKVLILKPGNGRLMFSQMLKQHLDSLKDSAVLQGDAVCADGIYGYDETGDETIPA